MKLISFRTILMVKNDNKMLTSWNQKLFQSLMPNNTHTFRSYHQTRVNPFSEFISNITGTLRKLLPNNTTHFSRHQVILTFYKSYSQTILRTFQDIKQYWYFQRVTGKQYYLLFQSLHQTILTFSELLANNTTHFSWVFIK